jgi:hypothetical protein
MLQPVEAVVIAEFDVQVASAETCRASRYLVLNGRKTPTT